MMSFPVRPLPPIIRSLIFGEIYPGNVFGGVCEKREHSIAANQKGPRNLVARSGDGTMRLCPVKDRGESQEYIDQGTAKVWSPFTRPTHDQRH
jgi:hypothetical protein